jgi:hypothetical protein
VAFGLGAIQLAVTLGWIAYAHFQPRILDDIGRSRLDTLLSVYVAAAGTMLGPLAGGLADLTVRRAGSRFPVVVAGGFLAGVLFVAVALAIGPYAPGPLRDAIPLLIVLWIAAMIVLQAPSLALAGDLSRPELLPAVASMVVATMLPLAVWPWLEAALNRAGGALVFVAGGVVVVMATLLAWRLVPRPALPAAAASDRGLPYVGAFALGVSSAFVVLLAARLVPMTLAVRLRRMDASRFSSIAFAASGILAPPLGRAAATVGRRRALVASFLLALACGLAAQLVSERIGGVVLMVVLGVALALNLDCALPVAFGSSGVRTGLTAGLYLGGVMAGTEAALRLVPGSG